MSLINDALRRKNQEKNPTPEKSDGSPMEPVQPSARNRVSLLAPVLLVLIVVVLALAALFFWKGMQPKKELAATKQTTTSPVAVPPTETKSDVQPVPVPVPETQIETPLAVTPAPDSTNVSATDSSPETNAAIATVPSGPEPLKLQGIFYRLSNPTALINGKTVGVGELVSGARVIRIEREAVTVERDGKVETLRLD